MASESIILRVGGMTCGHCVRTVEAAARGVPGVAEARADVRAGTLAARVADPASRAGIVAAVRGAGYQLLE